jgi:hypothetical protein
MKNKAIPILALACAVGLATSCGGDDTEPADEQEPEQSHVVGEIHFSGQQCGGDFESIDGTLAEQDADFYGYCATIGDDFEFVVGTKERDKATASTDFYLVVNGIQGPPVAGVCGTDGEPLDDEANYTGFEDVLFKNVNEYEFEYDNPDDFYTLGMCEITLFAEPVVGELNPNHEEFDYYVALDCGGLAAESPTDPMIVLNYIEFEFFFTGC